MEKLNTHSRIYCTKGNFDNWLYYYQNTVPGIAPYPIQINATHMPTIMIIQVNKIVSRPKNFFHVCVSFVCVVTMLWCNASNMVL